MWSKTTKSWSPCSHVCQGLTIVPLVLRYMYRMIATSFANNFLWSCCRRYFVWHLNRPSRQFSESHKDTWRCLTTNLSIHVDERLVMCKLFSSDYNVAATDRVEFIDITEHYYTWQYHNKKFRYHGENSASDFGTTRKVICDCLLVINANLLSIVFKLWLIIGQIFAIDRGVAHFKALTRGDHLRISQ